MGSDGSLIFDTRTDITGFNKGTKDITNSVSSMSKTLATFGKFVAGLYLVKKAFDFGKEAVEVASDLQEVQNVVDTAFGDMAYKCEEFADISIKSFGMSRLNAKKTASTYMSMGKSMGLTMDKASDMAIEVAKLTGDVSSFYNIEQDLASVKLKGIFTGETEALKDLGVVMTQENLQQYALSQGITKSMDKMTQAEKVSLRYGFVMNALKDAQGDFAKTSDSWANQTRILSENWKEFLGIIGQGLVKVLTPLIQYLNIIMGKLIDIGKSIAVFFGGTQKNVSQTKTQAALLNSSANSEEKLANETKKTGKEAKKATGAFDELNVLASETANEMSNTGIVDNSVGTISETNEPSALEVKEPDITMFQNYMNNIKQLFLNLTDWLTTTFGPLFSTIWNGFSNIIKIAFKDVFIPIKDTWVNIFEHIWSAIKNTWDKLGQPILDALQKSWENTFNLLNTLWQSTLKPVWDEFIKLVNELWDNHLSGLWQNLTNFFAELYLMFMNVYNFLAPIVTYLVSILGPIVSEVVKGIMNVVFDILGVISDVISGVMLALTGVIQFISGVFSGDWDKAWEGIKNIFKGVWDALVGILKGVVNIIISIVNGLIGVFEKAFQGIVKMVNGIIEGINGVSEHVGFTLPTFSMPKLPRIPKLATGTVVPANFGEFQAILGDNKREPEVVSPLSTMKQALKEAMLESGGGNGDTTVILEIDGREFGRATYKYGNMETKRKGVQLRSV